MQPKEEIASSETGKIKSISIIWLVPAIALLIGVWMLYIQVSHRGDLVTINFENGEGVDAGKTKIKVKNVQVGVVEKVELNDSLNGVVVSARIHNNDKQLLVEDSDFWVVRPKIGKGGITGLGTLVSGAYIELSPGVSSDKQYTFTGLENAPVTPAGTPGLHITLASSGERALQVGDVILFRGIKVGRIEYVHFNVEERTIYYDAFIESRYDELITFNTRFWEVNGFEVNVSADGIQVRSGTLETLISGGVTFDVPAGMPYGEVVTQREVFTIFPNKEAIGNDQQGKGLQYILLFKDSIRGLKAGAPVEFRGIKIGRVIRTDTVYPEVGHLLDPGSLIPVMISIEPTRIGYKDNDAALKQANEDMLALLTKGLHSSLATGSLLTGSKYITLQYDAGRTNTLKYFSGYAVIPTVSNPFDQVVSRFSELINKINKLPLGKTLNTTDVTLQQLTVTLKDVGHVSQQLAALLKQSSDENLVGHINAALINIKKLSADFSAGSATNDELRNTLSVMQDALTELKPLLIQLNQNPDSLIFGRQQTKDIEPKGRQQ
jgi:paraquat-inducible protein B